jgi:CRP-like cAMP-binding protein
MRGRDVCYPLWAMHMPGQAEVVELLTRVPVFSTLKSEDLERIAPLTVARNFDAGQAVFREGDRSDTCYIIYEGRARAVREHGDGRAIVLANFGPGDIFGELALFERERRSATVETLGPMSAVAVLGPDMRRLMGERPEIAMRLLVALSRRLRETNERLARRSFQTVQGRVASALSEMVAQAQAQARAQTQGQAQVQVHPPAPTRARPRAHTGAHPRAGARVGVGRRSTTPPGQLAVGERDVTISTTQADLAKLAGSSRESASRFLAVLERAGVISQGRGRLVVHDPEALHSYVF